jgi:2-C-methyl-D-erythritol 2,4-cyclodiphosphate synthase
MRIGHGFDVHKFGGEGPLTIAGVKVPYHQGFIAHSDGDVAVHALCDALLGALALGDIGQHFPDTDEQYKGINSLVLLQQVVTLMDNAGYQVQNVDITIVAQAPKMSPFIQQMKQVLSQQLKVDSSQVNVKATTTEGLGFTGEKLGIAVHAVALLMSKSQVIND